ncbi:hypothetical protein KY321_00220 [Candidatus Woesearchaeota archaeon]|nr:hypothetical protein [Candidatus Woesearchaeota archaeon]
MPNPQVHVGIGIFFTLVIVMIIYYILKLKNVENRKYLIYLLPIFVLAGAFLSNIPDIPELGRDYPNFFNNIGIDYHDKGNWNTPLFNVFFMHPKLDQNYAEQYDLEGLILTLFSFNIIGLILYYFYKYN